MRAGTPTLDESRLGNNIMPATEGSDVVKAGGWGSGLEVNEGGMVESRTTSIPKVWYLSSAATIR